MFNKGIYIILFSLVFILSMSVVVAEDTNITNDSNLDDLEDYLQNTIVSPQHESLNNDFNQSLPNDNYTLISNDVSMYYKNGSRYKVTLFNDTNPIEGAKIIINIGGVNYTRVTDKNGMVNFPINLGSGTYKVSTYYANKSITTKLEVLPVIIAKDLKSNYGSVTKFTAKYLNNHGKALVNTYVKFKINGKTYKAKTNKNGIATLSIKLKTGKHTIYSIHPNGFQLKNTINVISSISAKNLNKHYKSSLKFTAKFYKKNGKILAKKYIKFKVNGKYFTKKTNKNGFASLGIISKPGTLKVMSINTATGEKSTNSVKILPTLSASSMSVFSDKTNKFKVKLYKNEKLVKNSNVQVYINDVKKTAKTDSNGVASFNFKLAKGTYTFKSIDPYTDSSIKTRVIVKLASIKADNITAFENKTSIFKVKLLNQDAKAAKNTNMSITINGIEKIVKTDYNGIASVNFTFNKGEYTVISKDLATGYTLKNKITVIEYNNSTIGRHFDKYGVSDDGKTILAIGRASAPGEMKKYGYTFYMVEFLRICPYCGSNNLYWSIFWAGNEVSNWGVFPPTGNMEGGSAEGGIYCAHCDADFSIFGNEHIAGSTKKLIPVSEPIPCTKEDAYRLLSGNFVLYS